MITSIRSINFSNNYISNVNQSRNKRCNTPKLNLNSYDNVSFSGKVNLSKLSEESTDLVQKFAQQLQLNKIYKFRTPYFEHFNFTSIANKEKPEMRNLIVQYNSYAKDDTTKHLMCIINDNGEVFENGNAVKNACEIEVYEKILPELINKASKELKIKV